MSVEVEVAPSEAEIELRAQVEALARRVESVEKARADAERRLAYLQSEIRDLEDSVSSVTVALDDKRRVIRWNPAAVTVFARSPGHVLGRPFDDMGLFLDDAAVKDALDRAADEESSIRVEHLPFRRADGSDGLIGMTINPLRREGEALGGFFILGKDITDRVEAERRAMLDARKAGAASLAIRISEELDISLTELRDGIAGGAPGPRETDLERAICRLEVLSRGMQELSESTRD